MNLKSIFIAGMLLGNSLQAKEFKRLPYLEKEDFTHAKEMTKQGKSVLSIELTPTGVEKVNTINQKGLGEKIRFKIGESVYRFKLREKIVGDQLVIGPFSRSRALKIEREINQ
ncbi:MAG: hypothetical protein ACXVLQ_17600 [Bacteriovorax sp.]